MVFDSKYFFGFDTVSYTYFSLLCNLKDLSSAAWKIRKICKKNKGTFRIFKILKTYEVLLRAGWYIITSNSRTAMKITLSLW